MSWAQISPPVVSPTSTTNAITTTTALNVNVNMPGGKNPADYALAIGPALLSLFVAVFVVWLGARLTRKNMELQWARENTDRDRRWEDQRAHDRALFDLRERRTVYTNSIQAANRVVNAAIDERLARRWASESMKPLVAPRDSKPTHVAETANIVQQGTLVEKWDRSVEEYHRCFQELWRATEEARLIGTREFSDLLDEVLKFLSTSHVSKATEEEHEAFLKQAYDLIGAATARGMLDLGTLESPTPRAPIADASIPPLDGHPD